MTTLSKILALITTAASFAFLGFVLVALIGGPNWQGMTHEFEAYAFEYSEGENPTWSAKTRDDDQSVGGPSPVLPRKIVDVLNDINRKQQDRLNVLENGDAEANPPRMGIAGFEQVINDPEEGIKALILQDIHALKNYQKRLEDELDSLSDALVQTTQEVSKTARETELKHSKAEQRREDIYRLRNFVAEADADQYRAIEHQKKLRDTWQRYQGVISRLKERNEQLRELVSQRNRRNYEEPQPSGS